MPRRHGRALIATAAVTLLVLSPTMGSEASRSLDQRAERLVKKKVERRAPRGLRVSCRRSGRARNRRRVFSCRWSGRRVGLAGRIVRCRGRYRVTYRRGRWRLRRGGRRCRAREVQPTFPIRAAFYYPWFPETWGSGAPFTRYRPSAGFYDSGSRPVIKEHVKAMRYAGIEAAISSWWGPGARTDARLPSLLAITGAMRSRLRWAIYYELESSTANGGLGDPSVARIRSDLIYIRDRYASDPAFLKVGGRFVVFVYSDTGESCSTADRWAQANTVGAYVVLKVFSGYGSCARQPDGWHQYGPSSAEHSQPGRFFSISPGFWRNDEPSPRLARHAARWKQNIRDMVASGAPWQLVTTFDEWGEGSAVESAREWASASGRGTYLDALHHNGR